MTPTMHRFVNVGDRFQLAPPPDEGATAPVNPVALQQMARGQVRLEEKLDQLAQKVETLQTRQASVPMAAPRSAPQPATEPERQDDPVTPREQPRVRRSLLQSFFD